MPTYRTGLGFDLHRLGKGKKLIIGGVQIPSTVGTIAHSDGDILIHALCDSLLGATGKGDIGDYFPDSDKKIKGIAGAVILKKVLGMIKPYRIKNVDTIIVLDYPRLVSYKQRIVTSLQKLLSVKAVNVKIKSFEGLYYKKLIACYCTVLIKNQKLKCK